MFLLVLLNILKIYSCGGLEVTFLLWAGGSTPSVRMSSHNLASSVPSISEINLTSKHSMRATRCLVFPMQSWWMLIFVVSFSVAHIFYVQVCSEATILSSKYFSRKVFQEQLRGDYLYQIRWIFGKLPNGLWPPPPPHPPYFRKNMLRFCPGNWCP